MEFFEKNNVTIENFSLNFLTHSCLEIYMTSVVWTWNTFENYFGIRPQFTTYWNWNYFEQLSFKYYLNVAFVREILPKIVRQF